VAVGNGVFHPPWLELSELEWPKGAVEEVASLKGAVEGLAQFLKWGITNLITTRESNE
jgi:hypothetical protein